MILMSNVQWIITHTDAIHPVTVVITMSRGDRLGFAAEKQVGYCLYGEVVIKEKAQKTLHKYKVQFNEMIHQEIWSDDFPRGVNTASVIGEWDGHKLLLWDKSTSTTLLLSSDGRKLLDSWHHEGILLTCLRNSKPVYAVENAYGEYEIVIVKHRSETRIQPVTTKSPWSHPYLSVCRYDHERIAVTSKDHTLDIYRDSDWLGKHSIHIIIKQSFHGFKNTQQY